MKRPLLCLIVITQTILSLTAQTTEELSRMQTLIDHMAYTEALAWADSCSLQDEQALHLRAKALSELGRHPEAFAVYQRIIRMDPHDAIAYRLGAALQVDMQDYATAAEMLHQGYERTSDIPTGYDLAKLLIHIGQDSTALVITDRILRQDSLPPVIRLRAKALNKRQQPSQAIALLEEQMLRDSTDFLTLIDLATLYGQVEETRRQEQVTARYLQTDSLNVAVLLAHAESMMMLQEADSALHDYERIIGRGHFPTSFKDLFYCGLAYYKAGRWAVAEECFRRADESAFRQNYLTKYYLGMCAYRQKLWEEAEKRLQKLLDLIEPKTDRLTDVHTMLGRCANEQGRTETAISHLRYAIEYDSGNSEACLLLAQCFEKTGNRTGAIHMYRRVLDKERASTAKNDIEGFRRLAEARSRLSLLKADDSEDEETP